MPQKRKKLTISHFKIIKLEERHYFSYKEGKYEICLEPCLNGYDVALYIYENLVQNKICTNLGMKTNMTVEALTKAVKIANKLWNKKKEL